MYQRRAKVLRGIVGCVVAALVVVVAVWPGSAGAARPDSNSSVATDSTTAGLDPAKVAWAQAEAADRAAAAKIASDPTRLAAVLAEKQRGADEIAEAAKKYAQERASQPIAELCGVGEQFDAPPLPAAEFLSNGGWVELVGDQCVAVYAGQAGFDHPDRGAVFVHRFTSATVLQSEVIEVPGASSLHAALLADGDVQLTTGSGQAYLFRVSTGDVVKAP